MKKVFDVKSVRVEKHILKVNTDYKEIEKYILNCKSNGKLFEIVLCYDYSNSKKKTNLVVKKVKRFSGISYFPKEHTLIELKSFTKKYDNEIFYFDNNQFFIKYENLKPTNRILKERPVWIVRGDSGLGKSYLSSIIANHSDLSVYETDYCEELPQKIVEDIIVVGRNWRKNTWKA